MEIAFYLSLGVTLFLLFLLLNHLKTRVITLETQNEGLMDVIKMIRSNMVSLDTSQKMMSEKVLQIETNVKKTPVSVPSVTKDNITLEIHSKETEKQKEMELVNIDYPSDAGIIEIKKLEAYDEEEDEDDDDDEDDETSLREYDESSLQHLDEIMNSNDISPIQKMMFMMSLGQGFPGMTGMGMGMGMNVVQMTDIPVEKLGVEIVPMENSVEKSSQIEEIEEITDNVQESGLELQLELQLQEEIKDVVSLETVDVVLETVVEDVKEELENIQAVETVTELVEEKPDYHKMDTRTLRNLASSKGLVTKKNAKEMNKTELLKLFSS